jgi:4-hydroxy-tetrahydrodipicolinate reductase
MGKAIEEVALKRGHEIVLKVDAHNPLQSTADLAECDAAIEFSIPSEAARNMSLCMEAGVPVIVGTTGWYDALDEMRAFQEQENARVLTATNFSIGVNVFFHLNRQLAKVMNKLDQYEVDIEETHHVHKLDAPSGTAITTAEIILAEIERKRSWKLDEGQADELLIGSHRLDEVPGTHEVFYTSTVDQISFRHEARSRMGFAEGSVLAAEWLTKQAEGFYGMNDMLEFEN